jgi:acyl-CoA reductase-like NAD-dependent aldehyde dehydrogenase
MSDLGVATMNVGEARAFWVAGKATTGDASYPIHHPYDGSLVATVSVPTEAQVEEAVAAAAAAAGPAVRTSAAQRAAALNHVADRLTERADEVARLITAENGKPIKWARAEAHRAASTFRWAAEEARRWNGEVMRLDTDPASAGRMGIIRRFPYGPVLGIAPFNFPLNLVAHKVAPAIAVGAPIVLKPAPATPLASLLLGEILAETDLPEGMWSVLPVGNQTAAALVQDERLPIVSFTGSEGVGWGIRDAAPRKHVTLELGGNAAAVVLGDYSSPADLDWAATRIATFANYQAGQSCVSVQRVLIDAALYSALVPLIVEKVESLRTGDPFDDATDVGPVIDERNAERIEAWIGRAVGAGAELLTGGGRDGCTVAPTVLQGVPAHVELSCEEVFGPVMVVAPIEGIDAAIATVNDSRFGLQTGVFTHDVQAAFRLHSELEVGGVVIGDVPSYRADQMPYGGVKSSGVGREGLQAAMHDFTYERVLVLSGLTL